MSSEVNPRVEGSMFESLFVKSLDHDPLLHQKLRAEGFDVMRLEPDYPASLFSRCIEVAARHLWPESSLAEGQRRLGRRTSEGYRGTIAGSVVLATLNLMGPTRLMKQLPKRFGVGMNYGHTQVKELEPQRWELFHDAQVVGLEQSPEFVAGSVEGALALTGITPVVKVKEETGRTFTLEVSW